MLTDRYGLSLSTTSQTLRDKLDGVLGLVRLYKGDPIAALDTILMEDPGCAMAWAIRASLLVQQMDGRYGDEIARTLRESAKAPANERERAHLAAAKLWSDGRFHEAAVAYARIAQDYPRDLIALQTAHVACFYLGRATELRDWPVAALKDFNAGDDGRHAVLGMAAFGYEECGQYELAEELGREAVSLEPSDSWAVHAVAHVYEMRGDTRKGIPWLIDSAHAWAPDNGFAYHNWWHLALLHLDKGETWKVLDLYDTKVRRDETPVILEWIDAAALLWRLRLEGVDVGTRWIPVANQWQGVAEQGLYAFNDVHALMAFLGAGRALDAARTVAALRRCAAGDGDNATMARAVGLPVAEGLMAFEEGRYVEAFDRIAPVRGIAQRFGGSHAQRDILTLTMLHAALRGGLCGAAEALAAERVHHKPKSLWARELARQAKAGRPARHAA